MEAHINLYAKLVYALEISTKVCDMCLNIYHSMEISMGNLDKKRMERRKKEECEFLSTGQKTNYM